MPTDPSQFDDILKRFDKLTPEEREQLLDELDKRRVEAKTNSNASRSLLDAFLARGLVGSIKDAPPDWSTNSKYTERFGQVTD